MSTNTCTCENPSEVASEDEMCEYCKIDLQVCNALHNIRQAIVAGYPKVELVSAIYRLMHKELERA